MKGSKLRSDEILSGLIPSERDLFPLDLGFGGVNVRVLTNSRPLLLRLDRYYQSFLSPGQSPPDFIVHAIERPPVRLPLAFSQWPREAGKRGRKEEWADVQGGRVVRKVRTGMQFLIGTDHRVAFGPCREHDNQVINFINTQLINHHLNLGWVLGHASAVSAHDGKESIVIAAGSGGGKSTLALHLLSRGGNFVSNDRVLLKRVGDDVRVRGIPKLPRINPGTVLHNPRLHSLFSPEKLNGLRDLSREELWQLEEKHDVDLRLVFSGSRYVHDSRVEALVVLNWDRRSSAPPEFTETTYDRTETAYQGIRKGPGPFFVAMDGTMPDQPIHPDPLQYADTLGGTRTMAIGGGVDFAAAADRLAEILSLGAQ